MKQEATSQLFSRGQKNWQLVAPSIWSMNGQPAGPDPGRAVLQTLFDQPAWLRAFHLYDDKGSRLFEQICELPEYYLTRTEESILEREAATVISQAPVECIVELGAGFSKKTVHLLEEQLRQRRRGIFAPVDVSITGLEAARNAMEKRFPQLTFQGIQALFDQGIACIDRELPTLFVFLGSTLGNLRQSEFIRFFEHLGNAMGPHDFLLLGVDRIKDAGVLRRAYNDSQGITATFILNVFDNINRLLGSNFEQNHMRFDSRYNEEWQQVEMSSVASTTQDIYFPNHGASFTWRRGARILVEISRKFDPAHLEKQLQFFNLKSVAHFTDSKEWFSLLLLKRSSTA